MKLIKKNLQNIELILFYLIVFLVPSQLVLNIWPSFSFVYGLKIDYLSLSFYLTDILIIIYLFLFFIKTKSNLLINKNTILKIFIFLLVVIFNILNANIWELALIRWVKIIELILFSFAVYKNKIIDNYKIGKVFCYSILFFGLIGLLQFIYSKTLGGIFYYFGERTFTSMTPGISLLKLFDKLFLKPYSTFSHPNSLSGYFSVVLIYLVYWKEKMSDKLLKYLTLFLISILLFLTCSKAVIFTLLFILLLKQFNLVKDKLSKYYLFLVYLVVIFSLLMPLVFNPFVERINYLPSNISERIKLSKLAGEMLSLNPLFGVGLNNFISYIPVLNSLRIPFWFLQPVHNIYLLVVSETGLIGLLAMFYFLLKYLKHLFNKEKLSYILIFLLVLLTGFVDHYWLTLQQNIILIFLFLGLSKKEYFK